MPESETPKLDAAAAWLAQAKKGEVFIYWDGHLERACANPEANMSALQKLDYSATVKAYKKAGKTPPDRPDLYKAVRVDARAIAQWSESQENRGLVELRCVVMGKARRIYEMECKVQRNGLQTVRARETKNVRSNF